MSPVSEVAFKKDMNQLEKIQKEQQKSCLFRDKEYTIYGERLH